MTPEIERAKKFAARAHAGQTYGDHPYMVHLEAVALMAAPYGPQAQIAAYLHDTVEDCDVTVRDIAEAFGQEMADCIAVLTDESGENRKTRKAKTNAKLAASTNTLALTVKAADRLANLSHSKRTSNQSKLSMYRREQAAFKVAAYRPGLCDALWEEMEAIVNEVDS